MSNLFKWLQFFADGGASGGDGGGEGAGSGVSSADAGQSTGVKTDDAGQKLLQLGVPKEKVAKYSAAMARKGKAAPQSRAPSEGLRAEFRDRNAAEETDGNTGSNAETAGDDGFDVEAALKHPKMQQRIQSMMAERGKKATETANAAMKQLDEATELFDVLGMKYNVQKKDGRYDIPSLVEALVSDDYTFEDKALERGNSVEEERTRWQQQREQDRQQSEERHRVLMEAFNKVQNRTPEIQKEFPGYDFDREMQNPEFALMTLPKKNGGVGLDPRNAFVALHVDEILKSAVEAAAKQANALAGKVRAEWQSRPKENGKSAAAAAQPRDYNSYMEMFAKMTPEERRAYVTRPKK